jgi:hypothetical protein
MKHLQVFLAGAVVFLSLSAWSQQAEPEAEQELLRLMNQERQQQGAPALRWDEQLARAAREHNRLQVERGSLSHEFAGEPELSERLARAGVASDRDAENVAFDRDAPSAHDSLMHSPPHRANILNPVYNAVGIGAIRKGGSLYVTEDFARTLSAEPPSTAEKTIHAEIASLRSEAGLKPLTQRSEAAVRRMACAMAKDGRLDARAPLQLPGVHEAVAYTATQLAELSSSAKRVVVSNASGYAVGACFTRNARFPGGAYYVVLVTY